MSFLERARETAKLNTSTPGSVLPYDNDVGMFLKEEGDNGQGRVMDNVSIDCEECVCPSVEDLCADFKSLLDKETHTSHIEFDGDLEQVTSEGKLDFD